MKRNNTNKLNGEMQEIGELIEKKIKEIPNGSVTVIVQDNKPIQINTNEKTLI